MKLFFQKSRHFIQTNGLKACLAISSLLMNCLAWAEDPTIGDNDIGTMAIKAQGEATSVKIALWTITQAAGIGMFFGGLLLWRRIANEKSQQSYGKAILLTFIGAITYFLPYFMGAAASSLLSP